MHLYISKLIAMQKAWRKINQRLWQDYQLVLIQKDSKRTSYQKKINPIFVYLFLFFCLVLTVFSTFLLLEFFSKSVNLKESNNPNSKARAQVLKLNEQVAKLEKQLTTNNQYIESLRAVFSANQAVELDTTLRPKTAAAELTKDDLLPSKADSILRAEINTQENVPNNWLESNQNNSQTNQEPLGLLFPPIKGIITQDYSVVDNHLAVDIAAKEGESIKAAEEGTVILASWTADTGYVIIIRHTNGMITCYKHNATVYKTVGEFVEKGEVIAAVGNTGELTTGPHLHFEVWLDGKQVDPKTYVDL